MRPHQGSVEGKDRRPRVCGDCGCHRQWGMAVSEETAVGDPAVGDPAVGDPAVGDPASLLQQPSSSRPRRERI